MEDHALAPGACADCGNDAYIRLTGDNGSAEMVCAHCFVDRARTGRLVPTSSTRPTPDDAHRAAERLPR